LLIQVAQTVLPAFGLGGAVRVIIIVLAIGLVPVLIFAWAFELTPEGWKRESEVERGESISPQSGRKLDRVIMGVLALALGYFAVDKFVFAPQRERAVAEAARAEGRTESLVKSYGEKSIAVLPFIDLSPDKDQEYFSEGISEELLNLLAKIPQLRVISRSSAFSYKGKDVKLAQVADELNVAHILEGSVRKSGNKVRITAQLIEARSDTHLWSNTWDRELDDIFAVQDEIAAAVVEQLKVELLGHAPKTREVNPQAYPLFLEARQLRRQNTRESAEQAITLLQKAVTLDPDYAAAWVELAAVYVNQTNYGRPWQESVRLARAAVGKALAVDPDDAPANDRLGWIAMTFDGDLAAAARHYEQALAVEPGNTDIIGNAASLAANLNRLDTSIPLDEYANARDPVNPAGHVNLGMTYLGAGRFDEAIESLRTARRLAPEYSGLHYQLGIALLLKGEPEAALAELQKEPEEAWRLLGLAIVYHTLGRAKDSDAAVAETIGKYAADAPYNIAYVMAWRNERDRAFEWLDKAVVAGDPGLTEIVFQPLFANLRDDPRWLPFLRRIGKAPEQLAAITFDVKVPQ
jgi:TolB-like protein/Tfp pilus assembly protein PilF